MYSAIYLPDHPSNLSKDGFASEQAAWEYVFAQMCDYCKQERRLALEGKNFDPPQPGLIPNEFPPCACEWIVIKTDDLNKILYRDQK